MNGSVLKSNAFYHSVMLVSYPDHCKPKDYVTRPWQILVPLVFDKYSDSGRQILKHVGQPLINSWMNSYSSQKNRYFSSKCHSASKMQPRPFWHLRLFAIQLFNSDKTIQEIWVPDRHQMLCRTLGTDIGPFVLGSLLFVHCLIISSIHFFFFLLSTKK